ncbi:hypothetical protein BC835DRAFT_1325999 [Cytidiella melzeri]|nr:hypothetical protein BC835DRAFT_1325999 [Cytidiella melzeri]
MLYDSLTHIRENNTRGSFELHGRRQPGAGSTVTDKERRKSKARAYNTTHYSDSLALPQKLPRRYHACPMLHAPPVHLP